MRMIAFRMPSADSDRSITVTWPAVPGAGGYKSFQALAPGYEDYSQAPAPTDLEATAQADGSVELT